MRLHPEIRPCSSQKDEQSGDEAPHHATFAVFAGGVLCKHIRYANTMQQRPYIPHFSVYADTLGELYVCDSAAGLSLRE